jgi:hypothetical protein
MARPKNAMEIFNLLDKSNCRKCNEATCLAFAAAVFQGRRPISDCPKLDAAIVERYRDSAGKPRPTEQDGEQAAATLQNRIAECDLPAAAERVGGRYANGRLTIKVLGKDFSVDEKGNMSSDIHIHPWVAIPVLSYILQSKGTPVSGNWVPLRELPNGKPWRGLFEQRGENDLKKVADGYPELFEDMIRIFNGRPVEKHYEADISLVMHPLPKVPMLICYWHPEDGLESSLNLFFDATAEDHLDIKAIYALGTGMVRMFEKISHRHGIK